MKAPRIHDPAPRAPLADGIASSARHLVMLELLNTDGHRNYRSQHYPFLKALLPERGVQAEWLSLGVPVNEIRAGSPLYVYDLGEAERRCVIERLRALAPTHILLNERLEEGLWRALREALPAARFLLCDSETSLGAALSVGEWLHLDTRALEEAGVALEDFVIPDFRREPINFLASQIRPPIHLSLGAQCVFRKSIAHNPHFRELDLSESARSRGCSFCFSGGPELVLPKTPTLELAMRQIEAAERSATPAMFGRKYLVHGVELWFRIDAFVEALERQKIPPSSFEFSVRLDEVLGVRERLERALLRAQELGHTLGLMNTSVENFSAQENERFNKGIEPQTIDRALTLIYELEARFPQTLLFSELGGFGAILYTPWTTLEDLRINARAFRKFGVEASSFVFDSALQLVEGLPITRLAEADGLIVDAFEDYRYDSGCINDWQLRDIPWRFEHAEVAMAYALGRRLSRMATIPPNEPRYALVQAWLNGLEPAGVSVLDVFDALLEEMQARPEERSFMAI
ncbi:MAG: hypothetical protein OEY14_05315, partial [Myxococcales bacterium]|nr:hypothetical protein [Myxococcales bacterium]